MMYCLYILNNIVSCFLVNSRSSELFCGHICNTTFSSPSVNLMWLFQPLLKAKSHILRLPLAATATNYNSPVSMFNPCSLLPLPFSGHAFYSAPAAGNCCYLPQLEPRSPLFVECTFATRAANDPLVLIITEKALNLLLRGGHIVPPLWFFASYPNRRGLGVAQIADFSCM